MKKSALLTVVAVMFTVTLFAQQVPMYSHYYFNRFLYNPANTGTEAYGQAYLVYRNQWNQIADAPRTKAFTIDGPLINKQVGLGLSLYQDNAGQFNSTGGQMAYRYGLKLNDEHHLNFGLSLGFLDNRIDFNKLLPKHKEDPVLLSQYQNGTGFDATFGLSYNYDKLTVGFAVPQVLANQIVYDNITNISDIEYGMVRHYIGTVRYDFEINDMLTFEPIAMVRATPGAPVQYDVNAMFNYDNRFWLGGMYRSQYSATFSGAAKLFNQVIAGYSYDVAVNTYKQYMRGAHEVMLGYQFGASPADHPDIKKRFKDVDDKLKKNKDDIKENQDDINDNKDGIKDNKDGIEKNKDDIKDTDETLKKEIDNLRNEFEAFAKAVKNGTLEPGAQYKFNNVYFATDKWNIQGVDKTELNTIAAILYRYPNLKIAIMGHADVRGSNEHNERLSRRRAEAVRNYLVLNGISTDRLSIESFGENAPASSSLQENRRVEFKIISK